jgi:hypothetical protein
MATREPAPAWRNTLIWAAVAFIFIGAAMAVAISLLRHGGVGSVLASASDTAIVTASLILATVLVALGQRKVPFNPGSLFRLLVWNGLAIAIVAVINRGLGATSGRLYLYRMGGSAKIALFIGLALLCLALFGVLMVAAAHLRGRLLSPERREALLESRRVTILGLVAVTAMGLTLILLSLAGPGGVLPPAVALAGVGVLVGIRIALSVAVWRQVDELSKTLSRETGRSAFYLVLIIGGGWAILAHLGFVPAPAPLDWLSLFTVIVFAAGFFSAGRRGLLAQGF